jgi:hypothetical protein
VAARPGQNPCSIGHIITERSQIVLASPLALRDSLAPMRQDCCVGTRTWPNADFSWDHAAKFSTVIARGGSGRMEGARNGDSD